MVYNPISTQVQAISCIHHRNHMCTLPISTIYAQTNVVHSFTTIYGEASI